MTHDQEAHGGASSVQGQSTDLNHRAQDIIQECELALSESRGRVAESQRLLKKLEALARSLASGTFALNK
ncbi:MAG TPA: hypothetical protein VKB71_11050 [Rhizomicrobium sp.]|nr:hypothetical protein [Rhizomicrobium sp.]